MANDEERVRGVTTPYFDGFVFLSLFYYRMVSIMDNEHSWVASWLQKSNSPFSFAYRVEDLSRGIYAINVTGKLPQYIAEELQQQGYPIPDNFE